MSKEFRRWKIDEAQLLPPRVQDYVPPDHLSRLVVTFGQISSCCAASARSRPNGRWSARP